MRHRKNNKTLGRKKQFRKMMLMNLASSLILYEKIKTTETKAKVVRPLVEKLITIAKNGDLTARRKLIKGLSQKLAVKKMIEVIGPKYKERNGGYIRIFKLGVRQGDGAKIAQIELV